MDLKVIALFIVSVVAITVVASFIQICGGAYIRQYREHSQDWVSMRDLISWQFQGHDIRVIVGALKKARGSGIRVSVREAEDLYLRFKPQINSHEDLLALIQTQVVQK